MGFYELIFETCGHLCHQRPERSFFIGKYQFPFCARCSGILFGVLIGILFSLIVQFENFYLMVLLWIPMIIDGFTQKYTSYLSNNKRRLITGLLFGFGYIYIFMMLDRIFWWYYDGNTCINWVVSMCWSLCIFLLRFPKYLNFDYIRGIKNVCIDRFNICMCYRMDGLLRV